MQNVCFTIVVRVKIEVPLTLIRKHTFLVAYQIAPQVIILIGLITRSIFVTHQQHDSATIFSALKLQAV